MPQAKGTQGTCTVCGKPAWSPHSNKCEQHRTDAHGKPRVGKTPAGERSAAQVIAGALPAIDAKTFSGTAPNVKEWEEKLTATAVLICLAYVEYAVIKPANLAEPYATNQLEALALTEDEAATIVEPLAYAIAGTSINKKHGREAIEFLAFAPGILTIMEWHHRVTAFKREMAQEGTQVVSTGAPQPATEPLRREVPNDVSSERSQATPPAERGERLEVPVANFGGRGIWDPDEAPTKRGHPDGTNLDDEGRAVETAHLVIARAPSNEDGWARGPGES